MAREILLSSEDFIKSVTNISDNLAGKFILPSLREAQEVGLKSVLGAALLGKLKALVSDGTISAEANAAYKELLDECQYYLAYKTIVEVTVKAAYKIANAGVTKTPDENVQEASEVEIGRLQAYYEDKADSYCRTLQAFVLEHRASYPELDENKCYEIRSNLYSAASGGLWLGGARGKKIGGCCR